MKYKPPKPAAHWPAAEPLPLVHSSLVTQTPVGVLVSVVVQSWLGNCTMLNSEKTRLSLTAVVLVVKELLRPIATNTSRERQ